MGADVPGEAGLPDRADARVADAPDRADVDANASA